MKVTPVASPHAMSHTQTTTNQTAARDRAIQRLVQSAPVPAQQPQQTPVQDANNISPEEMGAITSQVQIEVEAQADTEAPVEATEQAPKPEVKEDPALSRQFAQLARQERALRAKVQQQEQVLKQREQALAAREAKLTSDAPDMTKFISKDRLKSDPLSVMAETGLSYDELTQMIVSQQPTDPRVSATISRLEAQIEELKQDRETSKKTAVEQQQASYQAAVKQISLDAKALVKSNPEEYEAIAKTGTVKEVVNLIIKTHEKTGRIMSVDEAAQEVENYLIEENLNMVNSISKIKRRLAQNSASPAKTEAKPQAQQQQTQMKTLTNATASTRKLSARERALLAFKGELK